MKINYWHKFEELAVYHIYNRGNNRENIFLRPGNYYYFMTKWKRYLGPYMHLYAYCLIPNHFHLIAQVREIDDRFTDHALKEKTSKSDLFIRRKIDYNAFLESQFKRFFCSYALSINRDYKRQGSLFQKKFKRVQIAREHQLVHRICYVHHNPIHHRYSSNYKDWEYSSFRDFMSQKSYFVNLNIAFALFHRTDRKFAYEEFIKTHQSFYSEKKIVHQIFPN